MEIKKVSIIGLGALGILFGHHLNKRMPQGDLRIIADKERIRRYQSDSVYCNGEPCEFNYLEPEDAAEPADLIIFAVKFNGLNDAIQAVKNQVGEHTIILSALNGITSEMIIGQTFGMDKILYCIAQGMDAVKVENRLSYDHMGMLVFGEREPGFISQRVKQVALFLERMAVPFEAVTDINKRIWGKFMLNVGVNQTVAVYESNYGEIQKQGGARDTMIAAMTEVMVLSEKEGINLTETDLSYWLNVLDHLNPEGKPSMRQDLEAKRFSEVELFSGAVLELGKKYSVSTPVNEEFYRRIKEIEA
jgi:2-dehydropantoate 2-reductase